MPSDLDELSEWLEKHEMSQPVYMRECRIPKDLSQAAEYLNYGQIILNIQAFILYLDIYIYIRKIYMQNQIKRTEHQQ